MCYCINAITIDPTGDDTVVGGRCDVSARFANYVTVLRKELLWLARACGVEHPSLVTTQQLEMLNDRFGGQTLQKTFEYADNWGLPNSSDISDLVQVASPRDKEA